MTPLLLYSASPERIPPFRRPALSSPPRAASQQRGRDNATIVAARKRPILAESMGLLLAVLVTAADVDGRAAGLVFARLELQPLSRVGLVFEYSEYHNYALYKWESEDALWDLVVIR